MRLTARVALLVCCLVSALSPVEGVSQTTRSVPAKTSVDSLSQKFVSDFDLSAAGEEAEARLRRDRNDISALFVRMEVAELQERPELVVDSALRLCTLPADASLQYLASNHVLQHAANTQVFK